MSDSISNLIAKLNNASRTRKKEMTFPYSRMALGIADALAKSGFIESVSKKGKKKVVKLELKLTYQGNQPKINGVKRISKSSKRIYLGTREIRPVRSGYGKLILSTPKGILSGEEARKVKVGGEALFEIW